MESRNSILNHGYGITDEYFANHQVLYNLKLWGITIIIFISQDNGKMKENIRVRHFCNKHNVSLGFYHILKSQPR